MVDDSHIFDPQLPEPSATKPDPGTALRISRDLRLIAAACKAAAATNTSHPVDDELITIGGWTIVEAYRKGLLISIVDLRQILIPSDQMVLELGTPRQLRKQPPPVRTVEDLLRENQYRYGMFGKRKPDQIKKLERPVKGPNDDLHALMDELKDMFERSEEEERFVKQVADSVAAGVVNSVWDLLAPRNLEKLPPAPCRVFLHQINADESPRPRGMPNSRLVKAEWVFDFLANAIGDAEAAINSPNRITLSEAAKLIDRPAGTILRACERGEITSNGKRGRQRLLDRDNVLAYGRKRDKLDDIQGFNIAKKGLEAEKKAIRDSNEAKRRR
jgi:hypothetical protein